ncbi:MAG: hypothetical protein ACLR3C_01605 [Eggerthella lenta]
MADLEAFGIDYEAVDGTHPTARAMRQLSVLIASCIEVPNPMNDCCPPTCSTKRFAPGSYVPARHASDASMPAEPGAAGFSYANGIRPNSSGEVVPTASDTKQDRSYFSA